MQRHDASSSTRLRWFHLALILLPPVLYYGVLFSKLIDIPFSDDYDILSFLIHLSALKGFGAKCLYVLTAQHNEYKLILEDSIFAIQYWLLGHVSFIGLQVIGDMSILVLAVVLWKMFLPQLQNPGLRLALFVPVSWLLFQLSYAETLNWAAPTIQNLYVPAFSFAVFMLLARQEGRSLIGAHVCLVLAICASGNGFFAALVGGLMLLWSRRFVAACFWTVVTIGMVLLYAYRYNVMSSQTSTNTSVFAAMRHLKIYYMLAFLGNLMSALPYQHTVRASLCLGAALCIFFVYQGFRGGLLSNQAVTASVVFILLTAFGVAGIRSDLGVGQSLSFRYRIYPTLLLALVWMVVCERYLQHPLALAKRRVLFAAVCAGAMAFSVYLDAGGYHYLRQRNRALMEGMALYEHSQSATSAQGPLVVSPGGPAYATEEFNLLARNLLLQSATVGVYRPPQYSIREPQR